jgi:hypothetical protein
MENSNWSTEEVTAIVDDYFAMLSFELAGIPYNKSLHRKRLITQLRARSPQSIEYKHANISAVLLDHGFPYINGYKPRSNYQRMLAEVVLDRLSSNHKLMDIAAADADRPMVVPEVDDILKALVEPPPSKQPATQVAEPLFGRSTNFIEREAKNRSLGLAGEEFVLNYERARLICAGCEHLVSAIEHTSVVRGDYEGYDILSFETNGKERLIEVKTTKYGIDTPFFVSRNEVLVSEENASIYHVYRTFKFRASPGLYTLKGAIPANCYLSAQSFVARPK